MADIFISYRRKPSASQALLIQEKLKNQHGIDAYVDTTRTDSTRVQFPERLMRAIEDAPVFVCLLGERDGDHTLESGWVLKEIERAYELGKFCIPVFQESYHPIKHGSEAVDYLLNHDGVHLFDERNVMVDESIAKIAALAKPSPTTRRTLFMAIGGMMFLLVIVGVVALMALNGRNDTPEAIESPSATTVVVIASTSTDEPIILTETPTETITETPTGTPTATFTATPTPTDTSTPTEMTTETPTSTATATEIASPTMTLTTTEVPTNTDATSDGAPTERDFSQFLSDRIELGYVIEDGWCWISPNGTAIVASTGAYSVADGHKLFELSLPNPWAFSFSSDDQYVAVEGDGVYRLSDGAKLFVGEHFIFSPDSSMVAVSWDGIYRLSDGEKILDVAFGSVVFSPDSRIVATGDEGVYDLGDAAKILDVSRYYEDFEFSPDSSMVAVFYDGIYRLSDGEKILTSNSFGATFSPDSRFVFLEGGVYRLGDGEKVIETESFVRFSPDSSAMGVGGDGVYRLDDGVKLVDTGNGNIYFSSDSRFASVDRDGVYRLSDGVKLIDTDGWSITFSPDNNVVAIAYDGIYRLSDGALLTKMTGVVTSFSADSSLVVVLGDGIYRTSDGVQLVPFPTTWSTQSLDGEVISAGYPDFCLVYGPFESSASDVAYFVEAPSDEPLQVRSSPSETADVIGKIKAGLYTGVEQDGFYQVAYIPLDAAEYTVGWVSTSESNLVSAQPQHPEDAGS